MTTQPTLHATYAEIDLGAIQGNLQAIQKRLSPHTKLLAVVKANAYGHGAIQVAKLAIQAGAHYLGVASLQEALALRSANLQSPILILSEVKAAWAEVVVQHDLTQTVYRWELAEALSQAAGKLGKTAKIHLKVDTGMGRIGLMPKDTIPFIQVVKSLPHLYLEGIFSHLASAHEKRGTEKQVQKFHYVLNGLTEQNIRIPIKHIGNTASTLLFPETHLDMVRVGIGLYGIHPHPATRKCLSLTPALSLKTEVSYLKEVPAGFPVSYGSTYKTPKPTCLATLPVGYADGVSYRLSNQGEVLIRGKRFPIVGTVCMDFMIVDLKGAKEIQLGDEAIVIGSQGKNALTAEEIAKRYQTIPYEVICGIGKRVPRVYTGVYQGGKSDGISNPLPSLSRPNV